MIYEHYYEQFMNTFMNTFSENMNTMNSLSIYTHFSNIKIKVYKAIHKSIHVLIHVPKVLIVFINRRKLFIKPFIKCSYNYTFFGGI